MNRQHVKILKRRLEYLKTQISDTSPLARAYSVAEVCALESVLAARLTSLEAHCSHCGYRRFHTAAPYRNT